jgi:type IV secretion system protein VirD4
VILPTIRVLGLAGESMVLSDPKGELYAMTAAWLRSQGYEVVLLDLLRPTRGSRWNPFAAIVAAHQAGDAEQASKLAWDWGNVLAYGVDTSGGDPIWPQAEESLMAALALATALEAPGGARHPATGL